MPILPLMRASLLGLVCLAVLADEPPPCSPAPLPASLTLAQAVDQALCRHPQTRIAWAQARAQAASLDIARAAFLPSLDASVSTSLSDEDGRSSHAASGGLRLAYALFDFGQRAARRDSAEALLDAARHGRDSVIAQVWRDTVNAYLNVARADAQAEAGRAAERAAQAGLAAAEARLAAGTVTSADVLQARTALSRATLIRLRAEGQGAGARGQLAQQLGLGPTALPSLVPLTPPAPQPIPDSVVEALIEQASQRRAELKQAQADLRAAEAAIAAARAADRPSLGLSANAGLAQQRDQDRRHSGSIALMLNIPVFEGGAPPARIRQAEAQRDSRLAELERQRLAIAQEVWQAWQSLRTAEAATTAAEAAQQSARRAAEVALGRYRAGLGIGLDVLNAQSAEAEAERERVTTLYDWLAARAALAYALGGSLPADLGNWTPAP
ncbi:TolC family protein [Chitinimonas lacunae]|uniref:Protein CyaE n=1 Tax=Chitinimonas lacunae TaxID=1963018 RepID=A0ABV8MNE9_9NEIS